MRFFGSPLRISQALLLILQEVTWINAWSVLLGLWIMSSNHTPLVASWALGLILIGGAVVTQAAVTYISRPRLYQMLVGVLGVLVAIAAVAASEPRAIAILDTRALLSGVLALFIWWRGILLGRSRVTTDDVHSRFRLSLIMLAVLFLLDAGFARGGSSYTGLLVLSSLVVLFCGLIGLPLANIVDLGEMTRYGSGTPAVSRQWLGMLLTASIALLGVTLLLTSVFTFDRLRAIFSPIGTVVSAVLTGLVYVIAVPVGYAIELLVFLYRLLFQPRTHPKLTPPNTQDILNHIRQAPHTRGTENVWWVTGLKIAIAALVVIVLIWALTRALSHLNDRRQRDTSFEERDFVWSWKSFRSEVIAWLRGIFGRRWRSYASVSAPPFTDVERRDPAGVREMYREFLNLAASWIRGRKPQETPAEYVVALEKFDAFDSAARDSEILTRAYEGVRYGQQAADQTDVEAVRASLERLRRMRQADQVDADTGSNRVG